jgi:acyl-CoA synthetase (NDP forming)
MVRQAGAVNVADMDELIDMAAAFHFLPPAYNNRAGVAGGSGGSSVMAADQCEEAGLDVIPLPNEIRAELKAKGSLIWDWIGNPADFSISMEDFNTGEVLQMMARHPNFDLLILFMSPPHYHGPRGLSPMPFNVDEYFRRFGFGQINKPLFIVMGDRGRSVNDPTGQAFKVMNEMRDKLIEWKVPAYPTISRAANAAYKMVAYYQNKSRASASTGR